MTNKDMMQVAETIRSQIHPTVLKCSASRNFGAYESKEGLYGIQFKKSCEINQTKQGDLTCFFVNDYHNHKHYIL